MCKKLIILLLVVAWSVPALAFEGQPSATNPLRVDIDGESTTDCDDGFEQWGPIPRNWGADGLAPVSKEWGTGLPGTNVTTELDVYRQLDTPPNATAGARNRSGGLVFVGNTGDFSAGSQGFGTNYVRLTVSKLEANTSYKFYLWAMEETGVWANDPCNPNSKYVAWSTTNPRTWLAANWNGLYPGEPPDGGYGPPAQPNDMNPGNAVTDSNMPPGLADLVLACGAEGGRGFLQAPAGNSRLQYMTNQTNFYAMSDGDGTVTLYGWMDATTWGGSMHVPLNGFAVVPEPATIALLGLGGLALIRRKK